jgi:L-iditol 2-dehydrogenase
MLQVWLKGARDLEFREVPVPTPGPGEAVVEVRRIGVCGSDIHVYHGKHKYATFPLVQGHEGAGIVTAVGRGVTSVAAGDLVTVRPQIYCGECLLCRQGRYNLCNAYKVIGVLGSTIGMASDFFLVEASKLHRLPAGMTFDQGAMVEPTAVGVHAAKLLGDLAGQKVLVVGAGPIGNLTAQAARALGAAEVMVTDINDLRLEKAKRCGIEHAVHTGREDFEKAMIERFGPDRADGMIDCAAAPGTIDQAVKSARRGTPIVVVGNFYGPVPVELGLLQRRELRLIGAMNYTASDYDDAIGFLADGKIRIDELVSDYFALRDYGKAYDFIDANSERVMKVLITVGGEPKGGRIG